MKIVNERHTFFYAPRAVICPLIRETFFWFFHVLTLHLNGICVKNERCGWRFEVREFWENTKIGKRCKRDESVYSMEVEKCKNCRKLVKWQSVENKMDIYMEIKLRCMKWKYTGLSWTKQVNAFHWRLLLLLLLLLRSCATTEQFSICYQQQLPHFFLCIKRAWRLLLNVMLNNKYWSGKRKLFQLQRAKPNSSREKKEKLNRCVEEWSQRLNHPDHLWVRESVSLVIRAFVMRYLGDNSRIFYWKCCCYICIRIAKQQCGNSNHYTKQHGERGKDGERKRDRERGGKIGDTFGKASC